MFQVSREPRLTRLSRLYELSNCEHGGRPFVIPKLLRELLREASSEKNEEMRSTGHMPCRCWAVNRGSRRQTQITIFNREV